MKKVLVVDNDDSFVYNIVEMLRPLCRVTVVNHRDACRAGGFDALLLSPGAGLPDDYPMMMKLLDATVGGCPILGVCLGHQAIAQYFGATLVQLPHPKHAHSSVLTKGDDAMLTSLTNVGRYHSWVVSTDNLPRELIVTSRDEDGNIMSLCHRDLPIYGVQFHPESIITDGGVAMFEAWLKL